MLDLGARRARPNAAAVALALLVVSAPSAGVAETAADPAAPPSRFGLPVACAMGSECFVQNHFDRDPGPGFRDYNCGDLSYPGHTGTDIRVLDYVAMARGVEVVAAAPGRVRRLRDGEPDVSLREIGETAVKGRESGNFVVLDHGGGWRTIYGHLRRDSVAVRLGQQVAAGDRLGLVGLSGRTEFPHVHFGVFHRGRPLDPFVGADEWTGCGPGPGALWSEAALAALAYRPSGLLAAGFAGTTPEAEAARRGRYAGEPIGRTSEAIVFWVDLFGVHKDDLESLQVTGPDGRVMVQRSSRLARRFAVAFRFLGKKRPEGGWPPGLYRGEYRLLRNVDGRETVAAAASRAVTVE
jgi:murein DD-endopeptidase MepM/ murein hydrolase activator NlpD